MFVYREVKFKDLKHIFLLSAKTTGVIMLLCGMASLFAWVTAREQLPDMLLAWILGISSSPYVFLMFVNVIFLFFGAILEGSPAVIILAPLFMPVAVKLGIDPIHFGTVIMANLGVGFLLPPVGLCLLVASTVGKVKVADISGPIMPYFVALLVALMLITYVPGISLFLPNLLFNG